MSIRRCSMDKGCGWLAVAALLGLLGLECPTHADEFPCAAGDVACLIVAIIAANANGETNTITLAVGTYTLTAVDHDTDGPTGLPSVISPLTLRGAGAQSTVIERAPGAPQFRLLHVAASGGLTLEGPTQQGGDLAGLPDGGAGVRNRGTLTIAHSLLRGHVANNGGGIFHSNLGALTITNSTLSGNVASGGGGIAIASASLTITNSTLYGNMAVINGGGISSQGGRSAATLINSTVSGNTANQGGGVSGSSGLISVGGIIISQNTLLAGNWVPPMGNGPDCYGPNLSRGHNLSGDPTTCVTATTDLTGDPGLGAFTDNGTPGNGHVFLLPDSPAINAGDPTACPPTDQLGRPRVDPCDIGAVEFQTTGTEFVTDVYMAALGRLPDASELAYWVDALTATPTPNTVRGMLHVVFDGPEFRQRPVNPWQYVDALYQAMLGREPNQAELDWWVQAVLDRQNTALPAFVASPEFQRLVPSCQDQAAVTLLVGRLYQRPWSA